MPKMGPLPSTKWQETNNSAPEMSAEEIKWLHFLTSLMWNTSGVADLRAFRPRILENGPFGCNVEPFGSTKGLERVTEPWPQASTTPAPAPRR